ncbi:MAG: hypothetical protein AAGB14_12870 [Verrucomicrobiota bacterium]
MKLLAFFTAFVACLLALHAQELRPNPPKDLFGETHRFVFHAVLEGCFESGVTQEEIDLIIPVRPDKEDRRSITQNLVYSCPLCSPAFDAFRLYSDRRIFISGISEDAAYNTFGQGLTKAQKASLQAGGRDCREVIQALISTWIERRIDLLDMNAEAERALRAELAEMRKEGEATLEKIKAGELGDELKTIYLEREGCPVCAGASPMAAGN